MQLIEGGCAEVLVNERDASPRVPEDPAGRGDMFCDGFRSFLHSHKRADLRSRIVAPTALSTM